MNIKMTIREEFRENLKEEDRIKKIINESEDMLSRNWTFDIHYYGYMVRFPGVVSHDNSGKSPSMKALEKILKGKNPDNVIINEKTLTVKLKEMLRYHEQQEKQH